MILYLENIIVVNVPLSITGHNGWVEDIHYSDLTVTGPKIFVLIENIKQRRAQYADCK